MINFKLVLICFLCFTLSTLCLAKRGKPKNIDPVEVTTERGSLKCTVSNSRIYFINGEEVKCPKTACMQKSVYLTITDTISGESVFAGYLFEDYFDSSNLEGDIQWLVPASMTYDKVSATLLITTEASIFVDPDNPDARRGSHKWRASINLNTLKIQRVHTKNGKEYISEEEDMLSGNTTTTEGACGTGAVSNNTEPGTPYGLLVNHTLFLSQPDNLLNGEDTCTNR